jgi:hypothetical protein
MSLTSYRPLRYRGRTYGLKDIEFSRFLTLAKTMPRAQLEVAVGPIAHNNWQTHGWSDQPARVLRRSGWRMVDAGHTCGSLDDYRDYIRSSKAEWSVAKSGYVTGQPGWFSCRSACYLAAGRPVVVQDTGLSGVLPTGEGLVTFSTPEEAARGIGDVLARYRRHATAAREIAREYFDSGAVLNRLVHDAMSTKSTAD